MRLGLAPELTKRMRKALREARGREIGGMLFAEQLAPDRFRVVDFSTDLTSGGATHFRRYPGQHREALDAFFARTGHDYGRFNYLGEWHSHPSFSVRPSVEDVGTMTDLVDSSSTDISFAVLLIVRLRFRCWIDYSLTLFNRGIGPQFLRLESRLF